MLSQVVELIEKKDRFAITSHVRPDGDGLGSSLGLFWLLKFLNKDVEVVMRDPAPHAYQQLPGANTIRDLSIKLDNQPLLEPNPILESIEMPAAAPVPNITMAPGATLSDVATASLAGAPPAVKKASTPTCIVAVSVEVQAKNVPRPPERITAGTE